MVKQIYKINTTDGPRYAIGNFHDGELVKGASPHYWKQLGSAQKALDDLLDL